MTTYSPITQCPTSSGLYTPTGPVLTIVMLIQTDLSVGEADAAGIVAQAFFNYLFTTKYSYTSVGFLSYLNTLSKKRTNNYEGEFTLIVPSSGQTQANEDMRSLFVAAVADPSFLPAGVSFTSLSSKGGNATYPPTTPNSSHKSSSELISVSFLMVVLYTCLLLLR